jgi:outer membrane protein assembly factor BamB
VWQNAETSGLAGDASFAPTSAVSSLVFVGSAVAPHLRIYDAASGDLVWNEVIGDPTTLGGVASGAVVVDGTLLVGTGVGVRSPNPSSPSDIASRSPSSLVALCVPAAPDC